jgi:hypothetical protein
MTMLKNIASIVTHFRRKIVRTTIKCERCLTGANAEYYVCSDVLHLRVCKTCADEATKLGLRVISINSNKHAA